MEKIFQDKTNEEWLEIRESLGLRYCKNVNLSENFMENYFLEMERLIKEIKTNPYVSTLNEDDKKQLIQNLYELDGMLVLYNNNMTKYCKYMNKTYNLYDTDKEYDFNYIFITGYGGFLHCHNYNKYLSWGNYFSPLLFEKYYMLMVESIEEFVKNRGSKPPRHIYKLVEEKECFRIEVYEYFTYKDIPHERGAHLYLPYYHQINIPTRSLEEYDEYYKEIYGRDYELYYKTFKDEIWPIVQWIYENRKDFVDTNNNEKYIISKNDLTK